MQITRVRVLVVSIVFVMASVVGWAQKGDLTHEHPATPDANVDFGVLPTGPLGPPPCLQVEVPPTVLFGSPADACAYKLHHLIPEEVTIEKGGQVTFQIHGGGHAMAIYEVSKNTTRDDLGQYLCPGVDPGTLTNPADHDCLNFALNPPNPAPGVANANANHNVADGKGNVVIVSGVGGGAHPGNRVWSEPGRLMAAGGQQFLNGGTIPAGPTSNGQLITYRFLKTGRYLVICANRSHFLNDWMFGFVNVVGG
jgi:hypothetical protein